MYTNFPALIQAAFIHKVVKMIEHRNENSQEVLAGWFTPEQMKSELKWSGTLGKVSGECAPKSKESM